MEQKILVESKDPYHKPLLNKHDSLQGVTGVDICTSTSQSVCQGPD